MATSIPTSPPELPSHPLGLDQPYVSTREAADLLGISLRSAQLWVENGVLVAWKTPGGHRRILLSSVQQVLAERQKVEKPGKSEAKLRVVLVEDDPDLLRLLSITISGAYSGVEVFTARDGFEGLVMIGQVHPDVLITDLNMPGMDGFRMLRAIGSGDAAPGHIVVITALSPADIADRGGLAPGVDVLQKPVALSQLEERIKAFAAALED
jgi:excisionase family DNA binding protein